MKLRPVFDESCGAFALFSTKKSVVHLTLFYIINQTVKKNNFSSTKME